ncbi:hypothetical protein EDB80DRAFT_408411 [Ilyonectria destructans]|nr:hypothetical protein EDB80DRAFT_408411 [Ilyonectria destructans]
MESTLVLSNMATSMRLSQYPPQSHEWRWTCFQVGGTFSTVRGCMLIIPNSRCDALCVYEVLRGTTYGAVHGAVHSGGWHHCPALFPISLDRIASSIAPAPGLREETNHGDQSDGGRDPKTDLANRPRDANDRETKDRDERHLRPRQREETRNQKPETRRDRPQLDLSRFGGVTVSSNHSGRSLPRSPLPPPCESPFWGAKKESLVRYPERKAASHVASRGDECMRDHFAFSHCHHHFWTLGTSRFSSASTTVTLITRRTSVRR